MENLWLSTQERIALLEEEVTQCHAHIDLYKLRVEEEQGDKQHLQVRQLIVLCRIGKERMTEIWVQ